jgi:hypothetical protein
VAGVSVAIAGGASATAAQAPAPLDKLFSHPPIVFAEEEIADEARISVPTGQCVGARPAFGLSHSLPRNEKAPVMKPGLQGQTP